jgi:hypothetical protein
MKIYFLHRNQQLLGPYTLDELRSQPLTKDDIIWKDGADDMVRAEQLDEFACMFQSSPIATFSPETFPSRKAVSYLGRVLGWRR